MIHQGTTFVRTGPLKYALPILLEDVVVEFPELRMVIAHLGHPWIAETAGPDPQASALCTRTFRRCIYRPWQFLQRPDYGESNTAFSTSCCSVSDYPFTTPRGADRRAAEHQSHGGGNEPAAA